jgi:predicted hydrolase (HD superfamily)
VLEERGWPQEIRHAILGHAEYTGTPRVSHLDKVLFACDELAGFLTACALIKPSKSIHDVEVAGVRKKLKDKAFARGVNREDVLNGASELGIDLDQHIAFCLAAMQRNAEALGLSDPPEAVEQAP